MTMSHKKIFILDGSLAVTGAFISARDMARVLSPFFDVELIISDSARIPAVELAAFASVHRVPIRSLRRRLLDAGLYIPRLLRATWRIHDILVKHPDAVLLVNDFYLIQGPLLRALLHRGPILTWLRIDPAAFGRLGPVFLYISAKLSDEIIVVSRHVQLLLSADLSSRLLYDPVSSEFLSEPEPQQNIGHDFVFLGNYIEGKGQDVALEAFARLLPHVPTAKLRFHGDDMGLERNRSYRRALEARAATLGLADSVSFCGFANNPRAVLCGAFAALNLSRSESFSRTVLEASACGLPIIATRSGGPAEIVNDGRTGVMIPVGDIAACASAMRKLCEDPALAKRMGEAGRARVMETFAPDAFSRDLRLLISEVT